MKPFVCCLALAWPMSAIALGEAAPSGAAPSATPIDPATTASRPLSVQPDGGAAFGLHYRSAFADYRPWQEATVGDWPALNRALADRGSGGEGHPHPAAVPATAGRHHGHQAHRSDQEHKGHQVHQIGQDHNGHQAHPSDQDHNGHQAHPSDQERNGHQVHPSDHRHQTTPGHQAPSPASTTGKPR